MIRIALQCKGEGEGTGKAIPIYKPITGLEGRRRLRLIGK